MAVTASVFGVQDESLFGALLVKIPTEVGMVNETMLMLNMGATSILFSNGFQIFSLEVKLPILRIQDMLQQLALEGLGKIHTQMD